MRPSSVAARRRRWLAAGAGVALAVAAGAQPSEEVLARAQRRLEALEAGEHSRAGQRELEAARAMLEALGDTELRPRRRQRAIVEWLRSTSRSRATSFDELRRELVRVSDAYEGGHVVLLAPAARKLEEEGPAFAEALERARKLTNLFVAHIVVGALWSLALLTVLLGVLLGGRAPGFLARLRDRSLAASATLPGVALVLVMAVIFGGIGGGRLWTLILLVVAYRRRGATPAAAPDAAPEPAAAPPGAPVDWEVLLPPDRYSRPEPLGRGGMGMVVRTHDRVLDRAVAVKVMDPERAGSEGHRTRFLREARSLAAVEHPGLPAVYDVRERPTPHILMEALPGRPLSRVLREDGPQDPEAVLGWLRDAGEALAALHAAGLVHRDVKPSNLVVDDAGRARLVDLGIAGVQGEAAESSASSFGYAPPERFTGGTEDARSDVFSLAVTAHVLLTDSMPFPPRQETAGAPPPPRELPEHVPRALREALRVAYDPDPARRPADMAAFLASLPAEAPALDAEELAERWRAWDEAMTTSIHPAKNLLAEVERCGDPEEALSWLREEENRAALARAADALEAEPAAPLPGMAPAAPAVAAVREFLERPEATTMDRAWQAWLGFARALAAALDAFRVRVDVSWRRAAAASEREGFQVEEGTWRPRSLLAVDPPAATTALEAILRDLLANARDAGAGRVVGTLDAGEDGGLVLELRDDGRGATGGSAAQTRRPAPMGPGLSSGLAGARRWVEQRGGALVAEGAPGGGFAVRISLPEVLR